jgi:hypothetical protein
MQQEPGEIFKTTILYAGKISWPRRYQARTSSTTHITLRIIDAPAALPLSEVKPGQLPFYSTPS